MSYRIAVRLAAVAAAVWVWLPSTAAAQEATAATRLVHGTVDRVEGTVTSVLGAVFGAQATGAPQGSAGPLGGDSIWMLFDATRPLTGGGAGGTGHQAGGGIFTISTGSSMGFGALGGGTTGTGVVGIPTGDGDGK